MSGRVMVVDDDEALRESVGEVLEDAGYEAVCVGSGSAALAALRAGQPLPAMILLDLMMPGMNGWQFRAAQLQDPALARIPVAVMTASRDVRGIQADEVLWKPIDLNTLLTVVRRHAGGSDALRRSRLAPPPAPAPAPVVGDLFAGGGDLGRRMAAHDWSRTPLGPVAGWPRSLTTCVRIILTSRQPMFVWWGEELINLYNDAYRSILGGKHPQALGQPAREVWREIWSEVAPRAEQAMRAQEGTYDEALLLIMDRNGYEEETYYTFSYSPVPGDDGGVGGLICANTDDTQRIVGERQLALLRELAAGAAQARSGAEAARLSAAALIHDPRDLPFALLYLLDGAGERLDLAGSAGIATGHAAAPAAIARRGATPWPLDAVLDGAGLQVIGDLARYGALPGGAWERAPVRVALVPVAVPGHRGGAGVLVVGLSPFRLFDERYRSFLELVAGQIGASVTNAEAYAQEKARAEALAALDRAKTTFFSNVSHELRTPLTLMLGPVEDLLRGQHGPLEGAQREQLALLQRSALRLQKLVNGLLDFARIEAGRARAVYEPIDLPAVTRDLASTFRAAVERAGLRLEVDCPPLPEPVWVDRDMWEKVVLNLLSNAFKFTFQGAIAVRLRAAGDEVRLEVADSGVGVPPAELPRLFERFHRVEGARARTHEGSGIGLALVQELIRLHGGRVDVTSQVDVGTTFTVAIPRGRAHLPERAGERERSGSTAVGAAAFVQEAERWLPDPTAEPAPTPGVPPGEPRARVLLADDNADMRDYVRRLLEPHWTVEAVGDGLAALEAARARRPDLVLSDVMMPGLDGFGLLRALRADPALRRTPVVLLSARAGEEATLEGLQAGAEDYLIKPFSGRELVARVRTHLELARLRQAAEERREHLQALFMQAPAPICVIRGPELTFELANDRYQQVVARSELVGRTLLDALPELAGQGFDDLLRQVMRTGQPHVGVHVPVTLDRGRGPEETWFDYVYAPLRMGDGVERVMTLASEVSERVRAQRRLEESEQRFRRLVDQVGAGIAQVDLSGRFRLVNERFREISGRSAAELTHTRLQDITHAEDLAAYLPRWERLVSEGVPFTSEQRTLRPDGSVVWVQTSLSRIDDAQGRPQGVAAVTVDITQRRLQLNEAEQALQFSQTFVGMLGHDLRNPLGAIVTTAELLLKRAGQDEQQLRPARRIRNSAERMARMIAQILDFTRARLGGGIPIQPARLDLALLVGQLAEELDVVAAGRISLVTAGDTRGSWDGDRLAQVISNLLGNAVEHGAPEELILVEVDGARPAEVELRVTNGGLIPPELLPSLFDPFRRARGSRRTEKTRGVGLGLYIVQQVVEAHGGRIAVRSEPGVGTRFSAVLPRESAPRGPQPSWPPGPLPAGQAAAAERRDSPPAGHDPLLGERDQGDRGPAQEQQREAGAAEP